MEAYIQLSNQLVKLSEDVTEENIINALGYKPFNGIFSELIDSPIIDDNSGEYNITDEQGNIITKINNEGILSTEVSAKDSNGVIHKLTEKADIEHNHGTIKLTGDVSGESIIENDGTTIDVTVISDSHYHDTRYYTKNEISEEGVDTLTTHVIRNASDEIRIVDNAGYTILVIDKNGVTSPEIISSKNGEMHYLSNKSNKDHTHDLIEFMEGANTVTTTEWLPINKSTIVANLSDGSNKPFSLSSTDIPLGRKISVIVNNLSSVDVILTVPNDNKYKSNEANITVKANSFKIITVISDQTNIYIA